VARGGEHARASEQEVHRDALKRVVEPAPPGYAELPK
jgi:hypothetical protein